MNCRHYIPGPRLSSRCHVCSQRRRKNGCPHLICGVPSWLFKIFNIGRLMLSVRCWTLCGFLFLPSMLYAQSSSITPVVIDYFYETGCLECGQVSAEVFPELQAQYEGFYVLNRHDVGILTNTIKLIAYQEHFSITKNSSVSIFVDYSTPLGGIGAIKSGLFSSLDKLVSERLAPNWQPPEPIKWSAEDGIESARERANTFTLPAVILGGLVDGINPCAISTLVFFMSLLIISKIGRKGSLLMGISFCFASFATYTAIGFGLLRCLHMLEIFPPIRRWFEMGMAAMLFILAYFSFRDAVRFSRTHDPHKVSLQLPDRIKRIMHKFMRKGLKSHHLIISGLTVGCLVTLLETVCTGQVYLPTMTVILKENGDLRIWSLLLLYNTMFIMPLVVALVLTRYGLTTETMLKWSKKNVPFSKTILGIFFLLVAVYLLT